MQYNASQDLDNSTSVSVPETEDLMKYRIRRHIKLGEADVWIAANTDMVLEIALPINVETRKILHQKLHKQPRGRLNHQKMGKKKELMAGFEPATSSLPINGPDTDR